jgi:hypothetical protein
MVAAADPLAALRVDLVAAGGDGGEDEGTRP